MNRKYYTLSILLLLSVIVSCTKPQPEPVTRGDTVFLPAQAGRSVVAERGFPGTWQISNLNGSEWFSVTPTGGLAGETELSFTTLSENEELTERCGWLDIVSGGEPKRLYVFQAGKEGMSLPSEKHVFRYAAGEARIEVRNNVEFSADIRSDWASIATIEFDADSVKLADNVNYSALKTSYIVVNVGENTSNERRTAVLEITCNGAVYEVDILQNYSIEVDVNWNAPFFKRSLGVRFTGSGCSYCPLMAESYKIAVAEYPDRIELCNIHGYNEDDPCYYANSPAFIKFYGISVFPTGVFNSAAVIRNGSVTDNAERIAALAREAVESYPAMTSLQGTSVLNGRELSVDMVIASKDQRDYKVHAFVMENNFFGTQAGHDDGSYKFDNIMRFAVSDDFGDKIECLGDRTVTDWFKTVTVPDGVLDDVNNAYLLIFVTYAHEGLPETMNVPGVSYNDFGEIVDNVVSMPLNGSITFEYEI